MGIWKSLAGTMSSVFGIGGPAGAKLKNNSGNLEIRNASDNAFTTVRGGVVQSGGTANDLATLFDLQGRIPNIEVGFAGASTPAIGANTGKYLFCHTTGGSYTAGDVLYDSGSALVELPSEVVNHLTNKTEITGTISLIANGLYAREGGSWVLKGDGGGGASTLDGLSDVVITSAASGQVLKFDGSNWINSTGGGDSSNADTLDGIHASGFSLVDHNHDLAYEPIIAVKNTAFNLDLGTTSGTISEGNHTHEYAASSHTHLGSDITTAVASATVADTLDGVHASGFSLYDHSHTGVYEPVISVKNSAFNVDFGTTSGTAAEGNHTHDYASSSHSHAINDLSDVVITSASSGQVLQFDGSNWVNGEVTAASGSGVSVHNELTGRDAADSHPITAITGLEDAIGSIYTWDNANSLLCHFDGADGGVSPVDSSIHNHVLIANGNAQLDTAQYKFGTTSLLLDGSGDYLLLPPSESFDFGTGDFTLECFFRLATDISLVTSDIRRFASHGRIDVDTGSWAWGIGNEPSWGAGVRLEISYRNNGGTWTDIVSSAVTVAANTWYHIAVVRISGVVYWYLDGTSYGTSNCTQPLGTYLGTFGLAVGCNIMGGSYTPSEYMNGWMDELRISKCARYAGAFTAPSAAFSSYKPTNGTVDVVWTDANDGPSSGMNADLLDDIHASGFALYDHTHTSADADTLDGIHSSGFALYDHNHTGTYEPVISVKNTAFNVDFGTTSGEAARGNHTHDYAASSHTHAGGDITSAVANAVDSDTVDGVHSSGFATYNHDHSGTYEPVISPKNTAFNVDFGTTSGTAAEGDHNHSGVYQPLDADLTAIAGLANPSGFLKKTAEDTWDLDTNSYSVIGHTHLGSDLTSTVPSAYFADTLDGIHSSGFLQPAIQQTVTFTSGMVATDIQALIDAVPKYVPNGVTVTFQFADGTYTLNASIIFSGFFGGGSIYIQGNRNEVDAGVLHTTQQVHLDFSATDCNGISVEDTRCNVYIYNLKISAISNANIRKCIQINRCTNSWTYYCYFTGTATSASGGYCFVSSGCIMGIVAYTYVSLNTRGIVSSSGGQIYSVNNASVAGSETYYGTSAWDGIIYVYGTYATGTAMDQESQYGGQVLSSAVVQPAVTQTVNFTSGMTATQINALIAKIPKYVPAGTTITFQFGDGTYTLNAPLYFNGFFGGGSINIYGNTAEANATDAHTTQSVHLDFSGQAVHGVYVGYTSCFVYIRNLKITTLSSTTAACPVYGYISKYLQVYYNYFLGTNNSSSNNGLGFFVYQTDTTLYKNYFSYHKAGIYAGTLSRVYSMTNYSTSGTEPYYGIYASAGAHLHKSNATQPAGTGASEYIDGAAKIWDTGTVWTSSNDGSGSGLDADTLDTYHASSLAKTITSDTTITVKAAGGDYTTVQAAYDSLKGKSISATVTILVDPGTWATLDFATQPYDTNIVVSGDPRTAAGKVYTATGNITKSSNNCTITLTEAVATDFGAGDYVTIAGAFTTAANVGRFPIVSISGSTITYTNAAGAAEATLAGFAILNPNRILTRSTDGNTVNIYSSYAKMYGFTILNTGSTGAGLCMDYMSVKNACTLSQVHFYGCPTTSINMHSGTLSTSATVSFVKTGSGDAVLGDGGSVWWGSYAFSSNSGAAGYSVAGGAKFYLSSSKSIKNVSGYVATTQGYIWSNGPTAKYNTTGYYAGTMGMINTVNSNANNSNNSTNYSPGTSGTEGNTSAIIIWS